jgi:hypothetical protein
VPCIQFTLRRSNRRQHRSGTHAINADFAGQSRAGPPAASRQVVLEI